MPSVTSPAAPRPAVRPRPMAAAASIATRTAPRQATRSRIECSGGPGRLARRNASSVLTVRLYPRRPARATGHRPGQATARTAAVGDPAPRPAPTPRAWPGPPRRPVEQPHDRAEGTLGHPLGLLGVAGEHDGERDRLGRRPFQLPHHQLSGMGRRPPVDLATGVAGPVRTRPPRLAHIRLHPVGRRAAVLVVAHGQGAPAFHPAGARCGARRRQGEHDPAGPPLQGERRRRGDVEDQDAAHPPVLRSQRDPVVGRAPPPDRADEGLLPAGFHRPDA